MSAFLLFAMAMPRMGISAANFGAYDPVFTSFFGNGTVNFAAIPGYAKFTHDQGTDTSERPMLFTSKHTKISTNNNSSSTNLPVQ